MQNSFSDPVEIVWRQGTEACAGSLLETLVGLRCMLRTELWEGFVKKMIYFLKQENMHNLTTNIF